MSGRGGTAAELTALGPRLRMLVWLRLGYAALVVSYAVSVDVGTEALGRLTLVYLSTALLGHLAWAWSGRRALLLVGGLLLLDGAYLAVVGQLTGLVGPARPLVLMHLVAVTVLASYRTGLKLALWHGLLLVVVYRAHAEAGLPLPATDLALPGSEFGHVVLTLLLYAATAGGTAAWAATSERELRRRRYDLEALADLSRMLEGTTTPAAVSEVLLDRLRDAFGYRRVAVVELGRAGGPTADGFPAGSVAQRALAEHSAVLVTHVDPARDAVLAALVPGARDLLAVPMFAEGRAVALLVAEHALKQGSGIERRVVSMTERFCAQAALALANARLLDQAVAAARRDGLTGLANRRAFDEALGLAGTGALPVGTGLLLLDVDHFKRLNDEHGHQSGDAVLRDVGAVLAAGCRTSDTAARYGGEEFAVVLPDASREDAVALAERLRVAVSCGTSIPVTVSVGVALGTVGGSAADLVARADAALYTAKRSGRDRVCAAPDGAGPGIDGPDREDVAALRP